MSVPTADQAREGAQRSILVRREGVDRRRAQVAIMRLVRPSMAAEEVARLLKCSPSSIRRDWVVLARLASLG